jgi:hypothetical protein
MFAQALVRKERSLLPAPAGAAVTSFVAVASFKLSGEKLYYFNKYKDPIE